MSGFYPELSIQPVTNTLAAFANIGNTQAQTQHTLASIPLVQAQAGLVGAQAGQTRAATVGQQIQNELQGLNLQYRGALYAPFIGANAGSEASSYGGGPPAAAPQGAGTSAPVMSSPLPPPSGGGGNALAPGAAGAGQPNALAGGVQGPAQGGLPPMSPNGIMIPGVGVPLPRMLAMAAMMSPDPSKAIGEAMQARRAYLAQLAGGATDPASWNANATQAWQQGWIITQDYQQMYGHFEHQQAVVRSLSSPEAQVGAETAAMQRNLELGPNGYQPSAPVIAAQGQVTATTTAAKGQYETKDITVPDGADANGQPKFRTVTVQVSQLPAFMAANSGAKPATSADMMNPAIKVSPDTLMARIAGAESGGNYGATNQSGPGGAPTSTAGGGLQFTVPTWVALVKSQRPDLAQGKTDQQIAAMRLDSSPAGIALQNQMGTAYATQNAAALAKAGLPVNTETLWLAHAWGAAGAQTIMQAPPGTKIMPALIGRDAFNANPQWQGKTVNQVQADAIAKVGINPIDFGSATSTGGARGPAPQTAGGAAAGAAGQPPGATPATTTAPPGGAAPGVPGVIAGPEVIPPTAKIRVDADNTQMQADAKDVETTLTNAQALQRTNPTLLQIRNLLPTVNPGSFGQARTDIANLFKTYGGDWSNQFLKATTGIDPNSAADMQEFNKLTFQTATAAEKDTAGTRAAGAALTEMYAKSLPNINMQGDAIRDMSNILLVGHQYMQDHATGAANYYHQQRDSFIGDPVSNRYQPVSKFDQQWLDPNGAGAPVVYVGAAAAMNGQPYATWTKGLAPQQIADALRVIQRADPTSQVSGPNGPIRIGAR